MKQGFNSRHPQQRAPSNHTAPAQRGHGYRGAVTSDRRRSQRSLLTGDSISATESAREDDLDDDLDDLDRGHTTGLDIFIFLLICFDRVEKSAIK